MVDIHFYTYIINVEYIYIYKFKIMNFKVSEKISLYKTLLKAKSFFLHREICNFA